MQPVALTHDVDALRQQAALPGLLLQELGSILARAVREVVQDEEVHLGRVQLQRPVRFWVSNYLAATKSRYHQPAMA